MREEIIHTTVQKVNGAISWSEGEDMGRHVVIGPDPKVKQSFRPRREGGRPRNNNFRSRSQSQDGTKGEAAVGVGTQPRPEIKKNAAAYEKIVPGIPAQPKPVQEKKPVKDESPVSPLYGKIEPKKGRNKLKILRNEKRRFKNESPFFAGAGGYHYKV